MGNSIENGNIAKFLGFFSELKNQSHASTEGETARENSDPKASSDSFSLSQAMGKLPRAMQAGMVQATQLLFNPQALISSAAQSQNTPSSEKPVLKHSEVNQILLSQAQSMIEIGKPDKALSILDSMTFFGNFDPSLLKMHALKAVSYHQMGDFEAAINEFELAKVHQPQARTQQSHYRKELTRLAGEIEGRIDEAKGQGDILAQGQSAAAAKKIYQALGNEEKVARIDAGVEAIRPQFESAGRKQDLEILKAQAQKWAEQGILTAEGIARYEANVPGGVKLSPYLSLTTAADGSVKLEFTPEFNQPLAGLSVEELQLTVLGNLEPVVMEGTLRRLAEIETNTAKKSYYQAKVDLMDGRVESARLHFAAVKTLADSHSADGVEAMKSEASQFLKEATRQHLNQLKEQNELLKAQRLNHLFNKEEGSFWVDRDGIKNAASANARLIQILEGQIESGAADTLDEALTRLQHEAETIGNGESAKYFSYYQNLPSTDSDFATLLNIETRNSLVSRETKAGKLEAFLAAATQLRHSNGSYEIAGKFLEGAMADELEIAFQELRDSKTTIRADATRGFESYRLKEKIKKSHEELKNDDPLAFFARYGEAPTAEQFDAEYKTAQEEYIHKVMLQKACGILERRYQSGEMKDATSIQAWETYKDMMDPFHKVSHFSDQGRDALMDEAVITAVTLPLTLGVGSAVRGAMSGSRLARRMVTMGRLGSAAVDAATFTAGSAAEALTQELLTVPFAGEFHAKNIGYNFAMSVGFHAGNKVWAREAESMGIGAAARSGVQSRWVRSAMAITDFTGMMTTQTALATGLSYVQDPNNLQDINERIGASALRMLGAHGFTKVISALPHNPVSYEQRALAKLREPAADSQEAPPIEKILEDNEVTKVFVRPRKETVVLAKQDEGTKGGIEPVRDSEILPAARRVWAGEDPRHIQETPPSVDSDTFLDTDLLARDVQELDSFLTADMGILSQIVPTDSFRPFHAHYTWPNLNLRVNGAGRAKRLIAGLTEKYGDRLQEISLSDGEGSFNVTDARGTPLIRIAMEITPQNVSAAEARRVFRQFHQEDYPILRNWALNEARGTSAEQYSTSAPKSFERGTYAQNLLSFFSKQQKLYAKKHHSAAELEDLAMVTDYLKEARGLIREMSALHHAEEALESREFQASHPQISRLSRELRNLGEDVRREIPVDDLYQGTVKGQQAELYRKYQETLASLNEIVSAAPASNVIPLAPRRRGTGTFGASGQPTQDLRYFSEAELKQLQELGLGGLGALSNPFHHAYKLALATGLHSLVKNPGSTPEALRESAIIRLVGALRHTIDWHPAGDEQKAKLKTILSEALKSIGRNPGGDTSLDGPQITLAPAEQNFLHAAFRDRRIPTPEAITSANFQEIILAVTQISKKGTWNGRFQNLRPSPTGRHILGKVVDCFGETLRAMDPQLHRHLVEVTGRKAQVETHGQGALREIEAPMAKLGGDFSTATRVASLVEADLLSFEGTRPSLVGEIPGLTPKMERLFEVGGFVEPYPLLNPRGYQLVELPSGADTRIPKGEASAQDYAVYHQWMARQWDGMPRGEAARPALESLIQRCVDLGITLKFGYSNQPLAARQPAEINEILIQYGPQLAYLNEIFRQIPESMLKNSKLKEIHLKSDRVDAGYFGAYKPERGSVFVYSGAMQGSRRNLAGIFLHELGHATGQRYAKGETGDALIPEGVRAEMAKAHDNLVRRWGILGLDFVGGAKQRFGYQRDYQEFLAELNLLYVAAGAKLREHIASYPEGSPARKSWDFVYQEMKSRIFAGKEYGQLAEPASQGISFEIQAKQYLDAVEGSLSYSDQANPKINWAWRKLDVGNISAATDRGISKKHNEDRFAVVKTPNGGSVLLAIDGMGGHVGGERAAEIVRAVAEQALADGKSPQEALELANAAVLEDNRRQGFVRVERNGEEKMERGAPGAVAIAVEIVAQPDGQKRARIFQNGDADAIVIRPGENRILHYTTRPTALTKEVKRMQGSPFHLTPDGRLARGQTLMLRIDPAANAVEGPLGHLDHSIHANEAPENLESGDIVIAGSDGLFENFGSLDIMAHVIQASGANTASGIRDVLMQEAMIRMVLAKKSKGQTLDRDAYRDAYREVTGQEPPAGWRGMYEPFQDAQGQWHTYSLIGGDVFHEPSGQIVDHFKRDNINVIVQVID